MVRTIVAIITAIIVIVIATIVIAAVIVATRGIVPTATCGIAIAVAHLIAVLIGVGVAPTIVVVLRLLFGKLIAVLINLCLGANKGWGLITKGAHQRLIARLTRRTRSNCGIRYCLNIRHRLSSWYCRLSGTGLRHSAG